MSELKVRQVECKNCGAKIDIRTGLRMKTFVCEYCGSICDNGQVTAVQNQQELKEKFAPRSFLKLGLKAKFLGREYQIVGRIRLEDHDDEESWFWDEWFLMSPTGYPLWIQEDETGFILLKKYIPSRFLNISADTNYIIPEKLKFDLSERGTSKITFIEGELTWKAVPGESNVYFEFMRGDRLFSIEYSNSEISYFKGKKLTESEIRQAFGESFDVSEEYHDETKEKFSRLLTAGILFLIFSALSFILYDFAKNTGIKVYDHATLLKVNSGASENRTIKSLKKGTLFSLDKKSIVSFEFISGDYPYPHKKNKAGWWMELTLYKISDTGGKPVAVIAADFWKEYGYDNFKKWTEEKNTEVKYLKLDKGDYYFAVESGANRENGTYYHSNVPLGITIKKDMWLPDTFLKFGILTLLAGIIAIAVWFFRKNSKKQKSKSFSQKMDEYLKTDKSFSSVFTDEDEKDDGFSWLMKRK